MFLLQNIQIKANYWLISLEPMLALESLFTMNQQVRIFVTGHFQLSSIDENQQRIDYDIALGDDIQYANLIGEKVPFVAFTSSGTWDWAQVASGTGN